MYEIEKNIPIRGRRSTESAYPFDYMEVGDSFFIPLSAIEVKAPYSIKELRKAKRVLAASLYNAVKRRHSGMKIAIRATDGLIGIRVWRTE